MIFNKKAIDIFWVNCGGMILREYRDYEVGDTFSSALTFSDIQMEPSKSVTKSLKRVDIGLYEGVGRIFALDSWGDYPKLGFDCGIYAFSSHSKLPEGIESGSYVKMQFYPVFDEERHSQLSINGEPIWKVIPGMIYDWKVKDILIEIEEEIGKKNFAKLPVAYTSSKGEIYKRISGTNAYEDCGENFNTSYILICEML
ncbi:hypothetical protein [Candidatus Magnetominusculus xianensis]|uniref:Uncharacterized protein n=1 Tax=Candidatus Magnetominusculus xianensis TaxID=1748249 RepID=A0ABR5SBD0_9BACT|nr:hypothetical protein [Candidatus Magnetominusculus xianensis]KWT76844.1 hypothetical protein ASN18_3110 [Candidatus Magnetominusculus xianensis]MBF0402650.1 hypothetical protein [Nitrospirota bacterium]